MRINNIIARPVFSEKSVGLAGAGKYVFKVRKDASKGTISNSLKDTFGVDVVSITTMVMPGKKRRKSRTAGFVKTGLWKKAIVKIKEGQKIELFEEKK